MEQPVAYAIMKTVCILRKTIVSRYRFGLDRPFVGVKRAESSGLPNRPMPCTKTERPGERFGRALEKSGQRIADEFLDRGGPAGADGVADCSLLVWGEGYLAAARFSRSRAPPRK